jgi:hypothetical protein
MTWTFLKGKVISGYSYVPCFIIIRVRLVHLPQHYLTELQQLKYISHPPNMPPKFDPKTPENASLIQLFTSLGLPSNSATELVRQPKNSKPFKSLIEEYNLESTHLDERSAAALVKLSTSSGKLREAEKGFVVGKVVKGDLKSVDQVAGELGFGSWCGF